MITDMRKMAEAFLASPRPDDFEQNLTPEQRRLELLCERHDVGTPVYVLYPGEGGVSRLRRQEMLAGQSWRGPWIQSSGPNAAHLIPVFKITRPLKGRKAEGIAATRRTTTLKQFQRIASQTNEPVAKFFQAALEVLQAPTLQGSEQLGEIIEDKNAFDAAVEIIVRGEFGPVAPKSPAMSKRNSVLLVVASDHKGELWPGDDPRLVKWLLNSTDRLTVYGSKTDTSCESAVCSLCGLRRSLYSNALPGAGLNFVNGDFLGSFPGMNKENSWQRFAICAACADHLYIYKNHIAPEFVETVVGNDALIIPSADLGGETKEFGRFIKEVTRMLDRTNRAEGERTVLRRLSREATVATISLLWVKKLRPKIDGIRAFVTHVLPTRLAELEEINASFNLRRSAFYPRDLRPGVRRSIDLNLRLADQLLWRPGGESVKSQNLSQRRRALLYQLADCVFHKELIMDPASLWREIGLTARAYWVTLLGQQNGKVLHECQHEAPRQLKSGDRLVLTLNGWVRHACFFLDYLSDERINVLSKETVVYQPTQEVLQPLLSEASGLNNDAKRFTFLLGVLYGYLIYIQAKKAKVNVAANALSWIKGGRLRAAELSGLCGRVTSKLLEYESLKIFRKSSMIHALEAELALLGIKVGSQINAEELPDDQVLYFLMLGIALSYTFTRLEMPKTEGDSQ